MAKLRETTSYIFKYLLQDAWYEDIYEIKIYDRDYDNIVIFDYNTDSETGVIAHLDTIKRENIEKIKEFLTDDIFDLRTEEIEKPAVMDGTIHRFNLRLNNKTNDLCGFNLWAFEKKKAKPHPNAQKIINLVDNIKKVLESEKIETEHFGFNF